MFLCSVLWEVAAGTHPGSFLATPPETGGGGEVPNVIAAMCKVPAGNVTITISLERSGDESEARALVDEEMWVR